MKKIYIVSSSLRVGSNSEVLAREFERGAIEKGHEVIFLSLKDFDLRFCKGCLACQKTGKCIIKDDVSKVLDDVSNSDVLVFSSPLYYYEMSGQLKTFLDRLNPIFEKDNKFKEVYFLGAAYDDEKESFNRAIQGVEGWISCFEGVKLRDCLLAVSTNEPNSVNKEFKEEAFRLGYNI